MQTIEIIPVKNLCPQILFGRNTAYFCWIRPEKIVFRCSQTCVLLRGWGADKDVFLSKNFKHFTKMNFKIHYPQFFLSAFFFHAHWRLTGQQRKGGDHFLFHFTTSTRSRTFRHLFATLHVRWLSHIFNCNARIYQTATRWYFTTLSNYHLIDWWCRIVDNGFALISV